VINKQVRNSQNGTLTAFLNKQLSKAFQLNDFILDYCDLKIKSISQLFAALWDH